MTDNNQPPENDSGSPKKRGPSKVGQLLANILAGVPENGFQPPSATPAPAPDPDGPLRPHSFRPEVELLYESLPRVLITPEAYKHMCLYVDIASKEVGWMGSVSRLDSGDFLIEETFLLEQEVHETETELASEDIGKLTMSLIDSGADGLDKANKLRFWGHSHVHMGTWPSGTDEATMERFGREKMPWYVRGIFNKYGHGEFTIYLYERGMRINDATWAVYDPESKNVILPARKRFGALAGLVQGAAAVTEPLVPAELLPSPELRERVQAEFKAKVKERKFFRFGRRKNVEAETPTAAQEQATVTPQAPQAESPAGSTTQGDKE